MSENNMSRTARRMALVSLISVMLVVVTLIVMSQSSTARPLPQAQPEGSLLVDMLGPDTTLAGRELTYTIVVTNATGQTVQNVVITNTWFKQEYNGNYLPSGLNVITATFNPTSSPPYIRWDLGTLNAGTIGSIVMTTYVSSTLQPSTTKNTIGQPIILANTAAIATSSPGVPGTNDSVNPLIVGPVMYMEKTYTPTLPRPGRLVTFTIKLVNRPVSERADSISSTNTLITELIPIKTTFYSADGGSIAAWEYLDSARLITYHLTGPVAPGQTVNVMFTVRVSPTLKNTSDVNTVRNNRGNFGFRSDEVTIIRLGEADVVLSGNDVIEKAVQVGPPPPPPGNPPRTFPDRVLTYTIAVYNPFTTTLSGFRITDTLPQAFTGGPYFLYSDTLAVAPYAAPTVISVAGRTVAWNLPNIEAWGVYNFALRVRVPPNFDTGVNGRNVDNSIYGTQQPNPPVIYDNLLPTEARVTVMPQLVPQKGITPGPVFSGYPETYTIWLTNTGNTAITNLVVTDTLPSDVWGNRWSFQAMIHGPQPAMTTTIPPQVIWTGITVPAYSGVYLSFRVLAIGVPPPSGPQYCNVVAGYSPDTFIPTVNSLACMTFLNPFRINKTAIASNNDVVLGETFSYRIDLLNVSLQDYELTQLVDILPYGFHEPGGGSLVTIPYDPPALFPQGGTHSETFDVVADGVPRDVCNRLPASIEQTGGHVQFTLLDPPETWVNAGNLGGITTYPHIMLQKYAQLPGAAPGEPITYTIVLTNYTSNTYSDIVVSDSLPSGFQFAGMLPGQPVPAPQVSIPNLVWTNVAVAPNGAIAFTFVATATMNIADGYENKVLAYSASDNNVCIPWLGFGTNAKTGPRVNIRNRNLTYSKSASPLSIGPLGLVQYNATIYNKGPYPVYNVLVTDVLPSAIAEPKWKFASNVNLPPGVTQVYTDPPAWRVAQINSGANVGFSFKARATIYPGGPYLNFMQGFAPGWVMTKEITYAGAPVTIVPGAALDKVVYPTTAFTNTLVVYTITLYNQSGAAITGLRITDTLPTGFTYDSMVTTAYAPDTIAPLVWSSKLPAVNNNSTLQLVFKARISGTLASGVYYNRVAAGAPNILIPNTDDTAPVKVKGSPNVSAVKTANPASTYRGGTTAYTITLTNESDDPLTVMFTDTLPTGFSFVMPLPGTPLPDSTSPLIWSNIALASAETRQFGFVAYVATDAPTGTVYNKVNVSSGQLAFQGTGLTAPVYVALQPEYDLQVTKDGSTPLVMLGDRITYTINYLNATDDGVNLTDVVLTDTFPVGGVTYVDGSGWTDFAPGVRTLNIGSLGANASGAVTIVLQIDPSYVADYLQNMIAIGGVPTINAIESQAANNTASAITFVGVAPQVAIAKIASPTLVFAGESLIYTLTLSNQSDVPVTLRVTDTMPVGFVFSTTIGATPQPYSTSPLVWRNLSVPPGQAITLAWQALVPLGTLPGFYFNEVELDANGLPLPGRDDLAQVETDIRRYYDLHVIKSDGVTNPSPGSTLNYTIRYTNTSSNVTLTQVVLTDMFSPTAYMTFTGVGWNQVATGVYTRALADLPPGGSGSVAFPVDLAASIPPDVLSVSNTVRIDAVPTQRATDTNPGNNVSTDVDIVHGADIVVTNMTYSPARLRQGGPITVVVTYQNQGVDAADWFGTDLYVKPDGAPPPTGPSDHAYGLCPSLVISCKFVKAFQGAGLAAGEIFTVTYTTTLKNGGTQRLYVQADPYWNGYGTPAHGRIVEGDEVNNIFGPVVIYAQPSVYLPVVRK